MIPFAVVAVNELGTFKLALAPKMIPAGLIKNRLDVPPVTWTKPLMIDGLLPVIRPKMLLIVELD